MSFEALNLFDQMQPLEVQWLLASAELLPVEAGDIILREGEAPASIFFVADGQLEVSAYSGQGKVAKVGRLQPGDVIGEISWLDNKPASGSVTATEAGMLLRLPISKLDAKLSADPAFGTHFLRGVATLLAQRLRRTTTQLRGLSVADLAVADSALASCLGEIKQAVERMEQEKASAASVAQFHACLHALEQATDGKELASGSAEAIRQELRPIIARSAIGSRCVAKPRGYAFDFATQEMVYDAKPAGTDPTGVEIDKALLELKGLRAVRGRYQLLAKALRDEVQARSGPVLITCLGAGSAPEMFELISEPTLAPRLSITCVEIDREAVAFLARKSKERDTAAQVTVLHANLLHLATGRDELGLEPQHLIYSCSLYDALGDDAAVALTDWCHRALLPGGALIVGAINPENPSRTLLSEALDWSATHRSATAIDNLMNRSLFKSGAARLATDHSHPGYLAFARKQ